MGDCLSWPPRVNVPIPLLIKHTVGITSQLSLRLLMLFKPFVIKKQSINLTSWVAWKSGQLL